MRTDARAWAVWGLVVLMMGTVGTGALAQPAPTAKKPATDEYHGVKVTDDYRWLEDWNAQAVKDWSEAQNTYARSVLDRLPSAAEVRKRLTFLETGASVSYAGLSWKGGRLFAIKNQPPKQQPMLVVLKSAASTDGERTLVDPNTIDPEGHTAIDWFVASPDGKLVSVSISEGGSESGTVHVYDVATGKETGDLIPRAQGGTAGGSLAWAGDGKGFFYTRYPHEGERPAEDMDFYQQVYFHALGTAATKDVYTIGKEFPRIAETILEASPDGTRFLASVQKGDGGEFMHFLRDAGGAWTQLTRYEDRVVQAVFGHDKAIYLVSRDKAPKGKVLRLALPDRGAPALKDAKVIITEQAYSIETDFFGGTGVLATKGLLYVWYQTGGPNEVMAFNLSGKSPVAVPSLPVSTVGQIAPLDGDEVLFVNESFITPAAWFAYTPATGKAAKTALAQTSPADYSDCEVVRETTTSKDGTKVPVSIIRKKGTKLDGTNPTVVWGYGGYGVNETPGFSPRRRVFIEQGGVFAIANIRGGGEFGEEWHLAGNLLNKQNVFDDFYGAAKYMIDKGYTKKDKLAIMGGSNGGLLMGATLTQHPDLCKAVVSSVGIYDMLRVELSSNGAFNVTEFGTVKDPSHFKALYAYSPYHHVADGTKYPAVLMLTGANDPRVDPMQSRKFTARLQAADTGGTFLLRTSANAGHGIGSSLSERIEQSVDIYAFLFDQLGVKYMPVFADKK